MRKLIMFISMAFLLPILSGCSKEAPKEKVETPRLIKAVTIEANDKFSTRNYPAKVDADEKVDLSFLVPGRLVALPVEEGKEVKKGELMAKLDPTDYEIEVAHNAAKYELAKVTYARYKELLPSGAISKAQYDEKKAAYKLAKANLDKVKKDLKDTEIFAPFAGVIGKRYVENHQFVQAKEKIAILQDIRQIELIVFIPEQDISNADEIKRFENAVGKTQAGMAEFRTLPGEKFPLYVKAVSTKADPVSQNYEIKFLMKRPEEKLILPGMSANVKVQFSDRNTKIQIPFSSVLVANDGKHYVWKINKKTMRVKRVPVTLGKTLGSDVDIIKGLKMGDTIATAGAAYLTQDMKVTIQKNRIGH